MKKPVKNLCLSEEETGEVLAFLQPQENWLVTEEVLREQIARTPKIIKSNLRNQNTKKIPRDQRTAYHSFAKKWRSLSSELKCRILNEYPGKVPVGMLAKTQMLEWLCLHLNEEMGLNDLEKRKLRTLHNTLDAFDTKMRMRICHDAGRVESEKSFDDPKSYDPSDKSAAMDAIAEAADRHGSTSVSKEQQKICTRIFETWNSFPSQGRRSIIRALHTEAGSEPSFDQALCSLCRLNADSVEGQAFISDFIKLNEETRTQVIRYTKCHYGAGVRFSQSLGLDLLVFHLMQSIAAVGSPRSYQNLDYARGHLSRELVQQAACILVLAGESQLSVSDTGKLSEFLRKLSGYFPEYFGGHDTWREAIEAEMGYDDDRRRYVESMRKNTENWETGSYFSISIFR